VLDSDYNIYMFSLDALFKKVEFNVPLAQASLISESRNNGVLISEDRIKSFLRGRKLQFDPNRIMLYATLPGEKFLAWMCEDIVRNTRNFLYKHSKHVYYPQVVKIQIASLNI